MNGKDRKDIKPGLVVDIALKQDQRSGKVTRGTVKDVRLRKSLIMELHCCMQEEATMIYFLHFSCSA